MSGDNLENNWGCDHVISLPSRNASRSEENTNFRGFKMLIGVTTQYKYILQHVTECGSTANLWAISDATGFDTNKCLFAAGSYVAGDDGALQAFTSSEVDVNKSYASILPCKKVKSDVARANTIALPYYIPGVLSDEELVNYENECLFALNLKIKNNIVCGHPSKALFMELVLAGNGALLSDRALICIGALLSESNMTVVVDEIMTAGRATCGSMLCCQTKPEEFQQVISHVTLGKWVLVGLILTSPMFIEKRTAMYGDAIRNTSSNSKKRGTSTVIQLKEAVFKWNHVAQNIDTIGQRRSALIKN